MRLVLRIFIFLFVYQHWAKFTRVFTVLPILPILKILRLCIHGLNWSADLYTVRLAFDKLMSKYYSVCSQLFCSACRDATIEADPLGYANTEIASCSWKFLWRMLNVQLQT